MVLRHSVAFGLLAVLAACAPQQAPAPEVTVVTPPPKVVVIEKPVVVEKRVIVEKPVVVERPVVVEKPTVIKVPVPKPPSACKGLAQAKCTETAACQWIKHASDKDKHGRPLTDYCRLKAGKAA